MNNKSLFIEGYLKKIEENFGVDSSTAFEIFSIAAVLDRSFQDVYDDVLVIGSLDGGIDGVYFQEQGDYYIMHVFQCKDSSSLKANQLDKFRNDFKDIFTSGNAVGKDNIQDLQPKIDEYKQLSAAGYLIDPRLYFLHSGMNVDPQYGNNENIYKTYHNIDEGFEIWDSGDLYNKISQLIKAQNRRSETNFVFRPVNSNISIRDNQALYSYSIQNVRATNFRIPAIQLCELVEKEMANNNHYDFLFSENIRGYLGMRARANKKMSQTIDDPNDAIYFPFLNNGITLICDRLTVPSSPQGGEYLIPTVNPVIVNGLQTTRVLFTKYKEERTKVQDIFINIRLYETTEPSLVDKITDATNTQTPINFRDKVANKGFNEYTKEIFELNGINYITKRGELFSTRASKDNKENINSDTVLKYWYATFYEKPEIAKNSISTVLESIYDATNSNNPLSKLFKGDKESAIYPQLLTAYKIYKKIQDEKRRLKDTYAFIPHADELLSYGTYKNLQDNLKSVDDEDALNEAYNKAINVIDTIVARDIKAHEDADKQFSYSAFFKRPKSKVEYNNVLGVVEDDALIESLQESYI